MPADGPIPAQLFTLVAAAAIFTVMFDLGLQIAAREYEWAWRHLRPLLKGLFAVLLAVPAMAVVVTDAFDLPRPAMVGIVLMALSPGAPVGLRRSLEAGGEASLAPALQIAVAALAIVSMPLTIAALNEYYAGQAVIAPRELARQVFFAQLLPLGLGMLARRLLPGPAARAGGGISRAATVLLVALVVLALVNYFPVVIGAGPRAALCVALITALALAIGHGLGGPAPETRTAVAISAAVRNPGLALVVASVNHAPPAVISTVLAYLVIAALAVLPYVAWRRRAARA
jgi:BASS family bile acid:Na+ symporter